MRLRTAGWLVGASILAIGASPLASVAQTPSAVPTMSPDSPFPTIGNAWPAATVSPVGPARFWSVTAWSRGFAALGMKPGERARRLYRDAEVWLSEDGAHWVATGKVVDARVNGRKDQVSGPEVWRLVAHRRGLLAIGTDRGSLAVWRSAHGRRWQRVRDQGAFDPAGVPIEDGYVLQISDAVTGHGRVVVSGDYAAAGDRRSFTRTWVSRDGVTWRRAEPNLRYPASIGDLAVGPDGFVGLTWARRLPEGCEFADASRLVRSPDGMRWSDVPGSVPICLATSLGYHLPSDSYFVQTASAEAADLTLLRSTDLRDWQEVYRGPQEIDGIRVEMESGMIVSSRASIAVVGSGSYEVDDSWPSFPWALTSVDGNDWGLSTGWPGTAAGAGVWAAALGRGRIVAVDVTADGGAWYTDVPTTGPQLVADCGSLAPTDCRLVETAIVAYFEGLSYTVDSIEPTDGYLCPRFSPRCPAPLPIDGLRRVEGARVRLSGLPEPVAVNVWLPRRGSGRSPQVRADITAGG